MLCIGKYLLDLKSVVHSLKIKCVISVVPHKTLTTWNKDKPFTEYSSVQDYYAGKSVFLTGGTGFLGKVILEKLLYSCPKLDKVYLLVRERDGEAVSHRLRYVFENPLFNRIRESMPEKLEKVLPVRGDLIKPHLGIRADDLKTLTKKVSIVIHTAASVKFDDPWDVNIKNNYEGTVTVVKLCQQIDSIEAFVYVSTVYAYTIDIDDNVIEEKVYPAPADIQEVYNFAAKYNNDTQKTKVFLGGSLNPYTYVKALAEGYIAESHGNILTCIVRPSIVGPKLHEPQIGWLDNWFGATRILWNVSQGLNRVTYGDPDTVSDFIPVDYVANACIVAAAKQDRSKKLQIYNLCSSEVNPITLGDAHKLFNEYTVLRRWNAFPLPFNIFTKSRSLVTSLTFLLQKVPAYIADFCLKIRGEDPRYTKAMGKVIRLRDSLEFFSSTTWVIKCDNVRSLQSSLSEQDRQLFPCDPKGIDWKKYFYSYLQGVHKFLLANKEK